MDYIKIKGIKGKVYNPDQKDAGNKKHPCDDCFACLNCDEDRCAKCRKQPSGTKKNARVKESEKPS